MSITDQQTPRGLMAPWKAAGLIGLLGWLTLAAVFFVLGAQLRDSVLVALGVLVQCSTGAVLWFLIRRGSASTLEIAGMGSVLGPVLAVLVGIAGNALVVWNWWWLLPIALTALALFRAPARAWTSAAPLAAARSWALPLLAGLLVGLILLWLNLRLYPLTWDGTWSGYHPDMVFFEALGYSVASYGPSESIFMVGGDIRYHWLTYAWSAQLSSAFNAAPFMVLTRALPVLALFGLVALVIALVNVIAREFTPPARTWASWLAVALVISGGFVGAVNGTILIFDSPSQALTSPWVLAWMLVVLILVTGYSRRPWLWITLAVLAFAITGGKVSAGAVVAASAAVAAAIGIASRRSWWRIAVVAAAVTVVSVAIAGLFFVWGSASPGDLRFWIWESRASTLQGLNSSPGVRGATFGTIGLLVAIAARWAGGLFLLTSAPWRARIEPWLGIGFVLAGVLPLVFFAQGVNETWFALTASAPLAVLSAVGLVVGWQRAGLGKGAALGGVLVGVLGILAVSYIWTDQVWESGFGRFWAPWLGLAIAGAWGLIWALIRRKQVLVSLVAVAALVLLVEASLGRATPIIGSLVGGARDGAGVRASELADPGLSGTSELAAVVTDEAPAQEPIIDISEGGDSRLSANAAEESVIEMPERAVFAWSADHAAAAEFLRSQLQLSDVIVTNEVDAFLVPALTRVPTYISGAPYQGLYGSVATAEEIPARLASNEQFLTAVDASARVEVCAAGATWAWIATDRPPPVDAELLGPIEYTNPSVVITRLEGCSSP